MFSSTAVVPLLAILAAGLLARRAPAARVERLEHALRGPGAPWAVGFATAVVIWWVWGSVTPSPQYHDEAAYIFQSRIFAAGRWAMPSPPLPEFFEQFHVLVEPSYASKYPPGHSLLMVPGTLLGLPALVPVLLSALAGALLFLLARRLTNPWVAAGSWLLWLGAPLVLAFHASYFSENTTTALWLAGWLALLAWREDRRRRWLVALAVTVGFQAITRPLTAIAYAAPVAAVVLLDAVRERRWADLAWAVAAGGAVVAMVLPWSVLTTGEWLTTPLMLHMRQYWPFDVPGFGLDTTPPLRALPPDMQAWYAHFAEVHRLHVPALLPDIIGLRLEQLARSLWLGWRAGLLLAFVAGALLLPTEGRVALLTAALLFAAYLAHAFMPVWVLYYQEAAPVLAFTTAVGIWGLLRVLAEGERELRPGDRVALATAPRAAAAALVLLLAALWPTAAYWGHMREVKARGLHYQDQFRRAVAQLPDERAVVFVRYADPRGARGSLVANEPDLDRARVWVVYDRGADNRRLLEAAPDRVPYLYDEGRGMLLRVTVAAAGGEDVIGGEGGADR